MASSTHTTTNMAPSRAQQQQQQQYHHPSGVVPPGGVAVPPSALKQQPIPYRYQPQPVKPPPNNRQHPSAPPPAAVHGHHQSQINNTALQILQAGGDEDYFNFVKSLGLKDIDTLSFAGLDNDNDEDFHLSDVDEEDDEDDDDDDDEYNLLFLDTTPDSIDQQIDKGVVVDGSRHDVDRTDSTPTLSSPLCSSPMALPDFENSNMFRELDEELGNLLEEDLEAAVQSLMVSKNPSPTTPPRPAGSKNSITPKVSTLTVNSTTTTKKNSQTKGGAKKVDPKSKIAGGTTASGETPTTPLRDAARAQGASATVTYQQSQQLRKLLTRHYQLLVQQSILAVRAAHTQKITAANASAAGGMSQQSINAKLSSANNNGEFIGAESADDLAEILDGAVGMLQDLDQNRRDAIRNSIQMSHSQNSASHGGGGGRRSLLSRFKESEQEEQEQQVGGDRRLTRAAFSRTLQQSNGGRGMYKRTAFDIPGLTKLNETFVSIDNSVRVQGQLTAGVGSSTILSSPTHTEACKMVLKQAGANIDDSHVPGTRDLSENFCDCREFFGVDFKLPTTKQQSLTLRKNRNFFTSGEDNLVLRGVNLYGEKQWVLIADRYLPDRTVNVISQRYSKLCVMLYKAHGISIDERTGALIPPPKLESVDDIDNEQVKKLGLVKVAPPALLNVHRWSLEEDLTLLKAVPIMGHMWAELGARLIPHRDRGHLRKRYQVLERRVKATVTRSAKNNEANGGLSKGSSSKSTNQPRGKANIPAVNVKPPTAKHAAGKASQALAAIKAASARPPPMTKMPPGTKPPAKQVKPPPLKKVLNNPKAAAAAATGATGRKMSGAVSAPKGATSKKVTQPQARSKLPAAAMSIEKAAASLAALKPQQKHPQKPPHVVAAEAAKAAASLAALRPGAGHRPHMPVGPPTMAGQRPPPAMHHHHVGSASAYSYRPGIPPKHLPAPGTAPPARAPVHRKPTAAAAAAPVPFPPPRRQARGSNASAGKGSSRGPTITNTKKPVPVPSKPSAAPATSRSKAPALRRRLGPASTKPNGTVALLKPPASDAVDSQLQSFNKNENSNTRLAFEKLADGNDDDEWSQLSRMKKMMENEEESEAADAIITHLAKSPISDGLSKLPNLELDSNSMSGLSVLQSEEVSRQIFPPEFGEPGTPAKPRASIMSRVLENSSDSDRKRAEAQPKNSVAESPATGGYTWESPRRSPRKRPRSSPTQNPTTPKRGRFFSTAGTPIGLRNDFRSPPRANTRGGGRAAAGITLTPTAVFSPGPSTALQFVNDDMGESIDGINIRNFQLPDNSQLLPAVESPPGLESISKFAGEEINGATTHHQEEEGRQEQHDPTPPPLTNTPSKDPLMDLSTDNDARLVVSALETLSNSPCRGTFRYAGKTQQETSKEGEPKKPKSLFDKVVGNAKSRDAKKKLHF